MLNNNGRLKQKIQQALKAANHTQKTAAAGIGIGRQAFNAILNRADIPDDFIQDLRTKLKIKIDLSDITNDTPDINAVIYKAVGDIADLKARVAKLEKRK